MKACVTRAQSLATTSDETGRKKILDTLCDVQYSLETPYDTLQRLAGFVGNLLLGPLSEEQTFVV